MAGPRDLPRAVKPRRSSYKHLPLIAVAETVLTERGESFSLDSLPMLVLAEPPSLVVAQHVGNTLAKLTEKFGDHPRWQFRVTPVKREVWGPNRRATKAVISQTTVAFFGFQRENGHGKNHYHYALDPTAFVRLTISELIPGDDLTREQKLLEWGRSVRTYMALHDLAVRPTAGGVAGQLLKDPKFYPVERRKVPKATNHRARIALPGNFYRLYDAKPGEYYRASYLDMSGAHHQAARRVAFPCANGLVARGNYRQCDDSGAILDRPWLTAGSRAFERAISWPGLHLVKMFCPPARRGVFSPPTMDKRGSQLRYVFSNEIPYLRECGAELRYLVASWSSRDAETTGTGLSEYAAWSLAELDQLHPDLRPWVKVLLLSTYGILAATPRTMEFGYHRAKNGVEKRYPIGSQLLKVIARETAREHEMPTANVIHRGMIEAETRIMSLSMARDLHRAGHSILAVYADSVFVNTGEGQPSLPLIPKPWRVQDNLNGLRFLNSTSFTSVELTKLPGISGIDRTRLAERRAPLTYDRAEKTSRRERRQRPRARV